MIIGRMDKRIILQKPNLIPDGGGGYKPAPGKDKFVDVATVWAEFKKPSMQTGVVAGAVVSDMTREIGIRYRIDVKKSWQAKYGTRMFNVLHTYDYGKETTILVCREVVI